MPAEPVQTLHIPAGVPIDQAQRPEHVQPGQANLLNENVRFTKRGGLGKRPGFTALSSLRLDGTTRTTGYKVAAYQNQAVAFDGHVLDVWSEALGCWVSQDRVSECGVPQRQILPYPGGLGIQGDTAITSNGIMVAAVSILVGSSIQLQASVIDSETNTVLRSEYVADSGSPVGLDSAGWMGLATVGETVIVFYVPNAATHDIWAQTIDCSSAAGINTGWTAPVTLVTDRRTAHAFDLHSFSTHCALAYTQNSTDNIVVQTYDHTATLITSTSITAASVPAAMSMAGLEGDTLWVSWSDTTPANHVIGLDPTTLAVTATGGTNLLSLAADQHTIVATGAGAGTLLIVSGSSSAIRLTAQDFVVSGGAVVQSGASRPWPNVAFVTKPIRVDGRTFVVVAPQDTNNNPQFNLLVVDVTDDSTLRPVATIAPRLSQTFGITANSSGAQHFPLQSGKRYAFLNFVERTSLSFGVGATGPSLEATYLDFGDPTRWQAVEYNGNLNLAGGVLGVFDGQTSREADFVIRPTAPTTSLSTGSVTDTGISYVAVFEGIDASGNVAWSALSDPSATISPSSQNVTVTVYQMVITGRYDNAQPVNAIRIALYRNASSTGLTTYYRVGEVTQGTSIASTVTFVDSTTAANVIKNAQLYKSPGIQGTAQDRYCPPGLYSPVSYNGMLVGVGDDGYTVWFSSQQVLGEETWWNPIFQFPVTDEGPITALAVMDGTLFIFKRRAIYEATGTAPSDNGASGGFNAVQLVSGNVGCRELRSIIDTNLGTFFLSDRGIELLVRGGQSTQWIGEPVRDIVDEWPVCVAATLDFTQERVRFEFVTAEVSNQVTGTGRGLVYNLSTQSWESADRRYSTGLAAPDAPAQSAGMLFMAGVWVYAWLDTAGVLYVENPTTWLDEGAWVTARFEMPWLKLGLQQQMLANGGMVLYENESSAGILLEFANRYGDYDSTFNKVWDETQTVGQAELEFRPLQENWAFKCRVSDSPPTSGILGTGQGHTFVGLSFDLTPSGSSDRSIPHIPTALRR